MRMADLLERAVLAWRRWAELRRKERRRTVLHARQGSRREGCAYRAWFQDPGRLERLAHPVASYAWSIDVDAAIVPAGVEGTDPHFLLSRITPAEVAEFRRRFAPCRDRVDGLPRV